MAEDAIKDLNLSSDEMSRFEKAFKDPEFKKLFFDYAKEISEPRSKEEAEAYIRMAEERKDFSMNGKQLLIPNAAFCVKTRNIETGQKIFINICHSDILERAKSFPRTDRSGLQWQIPYSLGPKKDEKDRGGKDSQVHDFVVNDEAITYACKNAQFKKLLIETSMEAVEKQHGLKLDRDFILPKLKYKGVTNTPSMLTISKTKLGTRNDKKCNGARIVPQLKDCENTSSESDPCGKNKEIGTKQETVPSYEIIHRSNLDLSEYWEDNSASKEDLKKTKEIFLRVNLPDVESAADMQLDVSTTEVFLRVPGKNKLKVPLPCLIRWTILKGKHDLIRTKRSWKLFCLYVMSPSSHHEAISFFLQ